MWRFSRGPSRAVPKTSPLLRVAASPLRVAGCALTAFARTEAAVRVRRERARELCSGGAAAGVSCACGKGARTPRGSIAWRRCNVIAERMASEAVQRSTGGAKMAYKNVTDAACSDSSRCGALTCRARAAAAGHPARLSSSMPTPQLGLLPPPPPPPLPVLPPSPLLLLLLQALRRQACHCCHRPVLPAEQCRQRPWP
jgi:hypothetical protein